MTNPEPGVKTKIILDILERNKIAALINTAGAGLIRPEQYNEAWIHFVPEISYDWVFPKMYAVIHHGGLGTTHLALKYGCASMIIPHILDQFVWNKIVYGRGAGPVGLKINKLSTKDLEPKILDLVNNPSYKKKAEKIAARMQKEDFSEALVKTILNEDGM